MSVLAGLYAFTNNLISSASKPSASVTVLEIYFDDAFPEFVKCSLVVSLLITFSYINTPCDCMSIYGAVCLLFEFISCLMPNDLVNVVPEISLDLDLIIIESIG